MISFADDLFVSTGRRTDWPRFAAWHYRSHKIGLVKSIALLWHGRPSDEAYDRVARLLPDAPPDPRRRLAIAAGRPLRPQSPRPIGIAVFVSPPMSLSGRNAFFGRRGRWGRLEMQALNRSVCLLQRLVLHPTYRGAGLAGPFLEAACERTGLPWVETLSELGERHPVFERAGFVRVGRVKLPPQKRTRAGHSALFGGRAVTAETFHKSAHASPTYFIRRSKTTPSR